ncbi:MULTISPECIES: DUF3592 domain-containing protein [unclassified Methanoregula]|uniref:DUF3592 domain-containing protein n=1 Tax=unclassified Methanoregula TaxID=2649730 RepID=UPI0009D51C55|nr:MULTISPECIES: DUF3592 domain-containing protein [unclassified Methanoregula]OPX65312.1 MAG: hypothetical protein A4E33_00345 [Methanoregula sp. PtaB.Bin085]OPY32221.1 MAG: hypothetical protein A4E34_02595 [Methanoregula sp. PtaU1.Bin006]
MEKNYSVNRKKDGSVLFEVNGALYARIEDVPDESDRAVLSTMLSDPAARDFGGVSGAGTGPSALAGDTARTRTIFLLAFGSIAIIMLLVAAISSYDAFTRSGIEERAPGIVVKTVEEIDEDTVYSYPVVAFTDSGGRNHTVKIPEGSSPPAWSAGDEVTVLYDPANPEDARTDTFTGALLLWLVPFVTGFVGTGFLLAVFVIFRVIPAETRTE